MDRPEVDQRPTTDDVLADLVALRGHRGITILRVKELATHLQHLRATESELAKLRLSPEDVHSAAYQVVKCAVHESVERPDLQEILAITLNFASRNSNLTERREVARHHLILSAKEYDRLEREAYMQLAGELALLPSSPCRYTDDVDAVVGEKESAKLDITITFNDVRDLARLLAVLNVSERVAVRDQIALRVLELIPEGAALVEGTSNDPWTRVLRLISAGITDMRRSADLDQTIRSEIDALIQRLFPVPFTRFIMDMRRSRAKTIRGMRASEQLHDPYELDVEKTRRAALEYLATTMATIEQESRWEPLLFDPDASPVQN
mgnify:CR=1 FL=1